MDVRRLPILAILGALLLIGAPPVSAEEEDPVELAEQSLDRFEKALKRRSSINETLISYLQEISEHYKNLKPPAKPELQAIPDDAGEEQREEIEDQNDDLIDDWESEVSKFERKAARFKKKAVKAIVKAFKLVKADPRTETNQREDVNIEAVKVLAGLGDPELSEDIIDAMERVLFKARGYEVTDLLFEEAFAALGKLNDVDALEWMVENFTHSKSSPRREVSKLVAAHKAMVLFKDVPGKLRYELVKEMVKTYSGVESQAETTSNDPALQAKKQFWDRIKGDAIKVVQYYADNPTNADGELLARMEDFQDWFRDHKNKRRAPWTDPEEEEG